MAVNYVLSTRSIDIGIHPNDLPIVQLSFMLSVPSCGLAEKLGEEVYRAIINAAEDLQLVRVRDGFQRCFFCGEENPNRQKACLSCGEKV